MPGFSKCERIHGHNYVVKVTIDYSLLNSRQLLDFREVNSIIFSIIEEFDHKVLLPGHSSTIHIQSSMDNKNWIVRTKEKMYSFPQKDVLLLDKIDQTTTENLAMYFHTKISQKMEKYVNTDSELKLRVTIAETTGNEASYSDKIKK